MRPSTDGASSSPLPIPRRRRCRSKHRRHRRISPSPSPTPSPSEHDNDDEEQAYSNQEHSSSYATTDVPNDDEEETTDAVPDDNSYSYSSSSNLIPTPSTYINVAPLPVFRGAPDECPVAHLSRFRRVCVANNAPSPAMMLRIFPVSLDGEAALWYELNVDPYPSLSWEEVKSSFLDAYRGPEFVDRARSDLVSLRQGDAETASAYYLRMQWILKRWPEHGLPDELLKGIFVDGLREDFQDWIVPQRPESLEEAVRLASSWERARSVRAARRSTREAKCGFCDGAGHEESGCEVRKRMKEMWVRTTKGDLVDGGGKRAADGESKEGEGEEGLGRVVSMGRRSQCQCWKHQCWRKIERSNSVVSEKNNNVASVD